MENANIIIEYLNGELSNNQAQELESKLDSDPAFREEYELLKAMYANMQNRKNEEAYQVELDRLNKTYFDTPKKGMGHTKKWLLLVLALITAALATWYFQSTSEVNLYDSHADHFALYLVTKNDANTIALNAENTFNNGDFKEAIPALNAYIKQHTFAPKAQLALGISYLEIDQVEKALEIFKQLETGANAFREYAIWYQALANIKLNRIDIASQLLINTDWKDPILLDKAEKLNRDIQTFTQE